MPDISNWFIGNVTDMSYIFCNCSAMTSFPDISKWNIKNVIDMNHMFSGCSSISYFPDISKWKSINVKKIDYMFSNCVKLKKKPYLPKWNFDEFVIYKKRVFEGCILVEFGPKNKKESNKFFEYIDNKIELFYKILYKILNYLEKIYNLISIIILYIIPSISIIIIIFFDKKKYI